MRANLIVYTIRRGVFNYFKISFEDELPDIPREALTIFQIKAEDDNPIELQETLETASQMTADNLGVDIDICRSVETTREIKRRKRPKR